VFPQQELEWQELFHLFSSFAFKFFEENDVQTFATSFCAWIEHLMLEKQHTA